MRNAAVQVRIPVGGKPDPGDVLLIESAPVTSQNAVKRNILPGIIENTDHLQHCLDLAGGKITGTGFDIVRDPLLFKDVPELFIPARAAPQQDDDIAVAAGTLKAVLSHDRKMADQIPDPAGNSERLFLPCAEPLDLRGDLAGRILGAAHKDQLCPVQIGIAGRRIGSTRLERDVFPVFDASDLASHEPEEHVIDAVKDFTAASEIAVEVDPLLLRVHGKILRELGHKDLGSCKTEFIDGLLYVADHKAVVDLFILGGDDPQKEFLHFIAVLVFIDQDLVKILPVSHSSPARLIVSVIVLFRQDLQRQMLQIREVYDILLLLDRLEILPEAACQVGKRLCGRPDPAH